MPKQTVSAIVKRLERNGYVTVEPSADDHRTNLILLTDKGQEYANHVLGGFVEAGQHAATQFDDEEFATLLELTRRFDVEIEQALGVGRLGSAIDVPDVSAQACPARLAPRPGHGALSTPGSLTARLCMHPTRLGYGDVSHCLASHNFSPSLD